ncbi:MAG TPA: xanthine dehydrogenase family protein molybdopterin-binding subunit [Candidatus Dormibacteraeota bacterium]
MAAVGQPTRRLEGRDKVSGATRYTADLDVPGLLHVQLVLSHMASARIRSIDVDEARHVPGVVDVVVASDLPDVDVPGPDEPLATERVFFVGQPVAAVIATSEAAAHDGVAAVMVDFEEIDAVTDPVAAMRDSSPVVLDVDEEADEGDASMHGAATDNESEPIEKPRNVSSVATVKRGDVAAALAASDVTIDASYSLAGVHHTPMEPHVSMVRPEPDGGFTIWAPTQGPFALRDEVAGRLGLPAQRVRVVPMPVGGGFGGKVSLLEGLLVLLARRANKPLRLVLTRRQVFALAKGAPGARFELQIGAKKDGTVTALKARYSYDNGATAGWHAGITGNFLAGTYKWQAVDLTGFEVTTNKTPVDAYRAPGAPQAYFALESAMDELALKLGMDPIELRLKNAVREGDLDAAGAPWPRIAFIECLEEARKHPLYTAPLGPGEAVGVAAGSWGGARTPSAAGCRVEPDGTLSVLIGTPDISGASTGLAMIAADAFGYPVEKVRIETGETGIAPYGAVAAGSQTTYSLGGAVHEAALEARRQLLEIATEELEAAPEDLEITDGRVAVRGVPDRFVEITQLVTLSTEFMGKFRPVQASGRSAVQEASPQFTVHIARVKADADTGAFEITGYAAIQDVGKAINPAEVEGQMHGGVAQSLGRALGEQLAYDEQGQLRTGSLLDYELPTVDQLPAIDVRMIEVPSPVGPHGAKGVGEPPAVPGAAALANAVSRATGVRVRDLPIDRFRLVL